jgi:thiamine pyrophosphokinase
MPIIAIGGLSGRFDQSMHAIHVLYQSLEQQRHVYLVADESIVFLLDKVIGKLLAITIGLLIFI